MSLRASFRIIGMVVGVMGCGKAEKSRPEGGSAQGIEATAAEPWIVLKLTNDAVIVRSGHRVSVIDAAGHVLARPQVADPDALGDAAIAHGALVWADGPNRDQLRVIDLASGKQRWRAALEGHAEFQVLMGEHQVAVLHEHGADLYHLADGTRTYHRTGTGYAAASYSSATHLLVDKLGHIEAVDDATGTLRWTSEIYISEGRTPSLWFRDATVVVYNGGRHFRGGVWQYDDGPFVELDLSSGKAVANGTLNQTAPGKFPVAIGLIASGGALVASGEKVEKRTIYRLDAVGRILWRSTDWFVDAASSTAPDFVRVTGRLGAAVLQSGRTPEGVLVGFDDKTGHIGFHRPLGAHARFIGPLDDCTLMIDLDHERKLECIDANGVVQWARPVIGRNAMAWRVGVHVLLADASPAVLTCFDSHGAPLWQTELAGTEVQGNALAAPPGSSGVRTDAWQVNQTFVVLPDQRSVHILDLATGKLAEVVP